MRDEEWVCKGAVLVNIYTDGSVLISHGGIEMGQGLNTKVLQVAAAVLGIPDSRVRVGDNATDKVPLYSLLRHDEIPKWGQVPNPTTTGGSQGSDVHGLAAKVACEELVERLKPIREAHPKADWDELIVKVPPSFRRLGWAAPGCWWQANEARVNLSATGLGRPAFEAGAEMAIRYFTTGAAAVEAELDTLSGEAVLSAVHIVMDVGDSLNPAVDIGQIEGGFMQVTYNSHQGSRRLDFVSSSF